MTTPNANVIALLEPVIYNTVNDFASTNTTLSESVRATAKQCITGYEQSLGVVIQKSNLVITGNFEARQKATIAMSCVSPFLAEPGAKTALQNALTKAIADELAKNNIANVPSSAISSAVARNVESAVNECRDDGGNQRVASGGSIIFRNSTVKIGVCGEQKLKDATEDCLGSDETKKAAGCNKLADCLRKEGDLVFDSGVNIRSSCSEKLYRIALDIAKVAAAPTTPLSPSNAGGGGGADTFWTTKNILIAVLVGGAILFLVGVLIALLARSSSRTPSATGYDYQMYPPQETLYAQQPAYPTY